MWSTYWVYHNTHTTPLTLSTEQHQCYSTLLLVSTRVLLAVLTQRCSHQGALSHTYSIVHTPTPKHCQCPSLNRTTHSSQLNGGQQLEQISSVVVIQVEKEVFPIPLELNGGKLDEGERREGREEGREGTEGGR